MYNSEISSEVLLTKVGSVVLGLLRCCAAVCVIEVGTVTFGPSLVSLHHDTSCVLCMNVVSI